MSISEDGCVRATIKTLANTHRETIENEGWVCIEGISQQALEFIKEEDAEIQYFVTSYETSVGSAAPYVEESPHIRLNIFEKYFNQQQ